VLSKSRDGCYEIDALWNVTTSFQFKSKKRNYCHPKYHRQET